MTTDERERQERARQRRATWIVAPLADAPLPASECIDDRLEQLEQLRRAGCALAGIPYPEGPTPKHLRRRWPVERIG
ncbi:hypothetical protein PPSIR1_29443 [Plesiocystis pacifica SIR-1]|uniref:Uncharacterized protein n=1 Tax=Plesiocystis pacifica SIR-1 TaxID=391625 RepID=A6G656_9BACT|nr:hypothetical protein PPSIR1_29443 [Plesiocystis pacifica SIR-1]